MTDDKSLVGQSLDGDQGLADIRGALDPGRSPARSPLAPAIPQPINALLLESPWCSARTRTLRHRQA